MLPHMQAQRKAPQNRFENVKRKRTIVPPSSSCRPVILLLRVLCVLFLTPVTQGIIGSDGMCPLFVFTPFTFGPIPTIPLSGRYQNLTNQGFSHMSGALLAMDHFNNRNASVVPELASLLEGCNVRFDMNQSRVLDTGSVTHLASQSLWQQDIEPCAIAGPFNDNPAIDLSVLALSAEIPLVAHRAYNFRIASNDLSPFSSQVFPGILASARNLAEYLVFKERTSYIGLLYSLTETGIQRREAVGLELDNFDMEWTANGYDIYNPIDQQEDSFLTAMKRVKESGYRTIVVAMDFPDAEMHPLANAAEQLEMNQGDYFWIWYSIFDPRFTQIENSNMTKLLAGSALLLPFSKAYLEPETDRFAKAWYSQGKEDVDRLNAANPINPGETGYVFAEEDWFQVVEIEYGADFLYDAVMSVGIGACLAEKVSNGTISGADHQTSIRQVSFTGATGIVSFGGGSSRDEIGVRDPSTVLWSEFNILPPQSDGNETVYFSVTGLYEPEFKEWRQLESLDPFVYRDGRTAPPLLRKQPDQNYLSSGLRALGLALMSIALFTAAGCALWVFLRRKNRVLRASQPVFLYLIAFGAAVEATAIFVISNDESYGWTEDALSSACMASPWLLACGHIIIYSALFSKLWRVNKVLQFSRRKIEVKHVVAPMIAIVTMALLVLSLWTGLDPLVWSRIETNDITGESIGYCVSERFAAFMIPLVVLMLIPTILTALMAWKTMDVDEAYAESKWIFSMILVQLEVCVIAIPLIFILRDVSTDGRYLGFMFMLWVFPMSTLLFIFLPKYLAYRTAQRGGEIGSSVIRGQRKGVVVSGVSRSVASNNSKPKTPAMHSSLEDNLNSSEVNPNIDPLSNVMRATISEASATEENPGGNNTEE